MSDSDPGPTIPAFESEMDRLEAGRPIGMPHFALIKKEADILGLTEEDARYAEDCWLANGFRGRHGRKVVDFRAALRLWQKEGWFPSQKKARRAGAHVDLLVPTEAEVMAYAAKRKWRTSYGRWCYEYFIGNNWRFYGRPITSTAQWQALMATELMKLAPR